MEPIRAPSGDKLRLNLSGTSTADESSSWGRGEMHLLHLHVIGHGIYRYYFVHLSEGLGFRSEEGTSEECHFSRFRTFFFLQLACSNSVPIAPESPVYGGFLRIVNGSLLEMGVVLVIWQYFWTSNWKYRRYMWFMTRSIDLLKRRLELTIAGVFLALLEGCRIPDKLWVMGVIQKQCIAVSASVDAIGYTWCDTHFLLQLLTSCFPGCLKVLQHGTLPRNTTEDGEGEEKKLTTMWKSGDQNESVSYPSLVLFFFGFISPWLSFLPFFPRTIGSLVSGLYRFVKCLAWRQSLAWVQKYCEMYQVKYPIVHSLKNDRTQHWHRSVLRIVSALLSITVDEKFDTFLKCSLG